MPGQLFYVFCVALLVSFAAGSELGSEKSNADVIQALESYIQWTELISNQYAKGDITQDKMADFEKQGEHVHEALFAALNDSQTSWKKDNDFSESVLELLESELLETDVDNEKIVGLVFADSIESGQGARLSIASRIFGQLSIRLRAAFHEAKKNLSSEILVTTIAVEAAEIAFDTMMESFELIDKMHQVVEKEEEEDTGALSRPKRQLRRSIRLGGGFTLGRSLRWNRGRTSAYLTPHFNFQPRFRFNGATAGFNHNFRNGRGSVYGRATYRGGRFRSASFGFRIRF